MTKGIFCLTLLCGVNGFCEYWVRLPESSNNEFREFLARNHRISFVENFSIESKRQNFDPPSLDKALELAATSPVDSLALFDATLSEIQKQVLNDEGRNILAAVLAKIGELNLPNRLKVSYQSRLQSLHRSVDAESRATNLVTSKDFQLFLQHLQSEHGLEDAEIFCDGWPRSVIEKIPYSKGVKQWAVISNAFVPFIVIGTWSEFQNELTKQTWKAAFATGDCRHLRWENADLSLTSSAGVFANAHCGQSTAQNYLEQSPTAHHLSNDPFGKNSKPPNWDPDPNWRWTVPVLSVVGAAALYSLKDKHVTVTAPSFH